MISDHFKTGLYSTFSENELLKNLTWKGDYSITRAPHVIERHDFSGRGRQSDRVTYPKAPAKPFVLAFIGCD